ncbi:MAG: dihydropteroate synthase [Anaerolineae bacterium]|jgi:5-methyltetrahydrofolate--homocysteine methyltransferase|nr:dihydropteroate synthase [Chloroflexota bacterium]
METRLTRDRRELLIGEGRPIAVIGERINPTGRRTLAEQLARGEFTLVQRDAQAQSAAGAALLDVNVGVPGADQPALMARAVRAIGEVTDLPLCLDSADPQVLEAGLQACEGIALVNSVTGEERSLESVLPLVQAHQAAVIALPMDDKGIPATAEERLAVAERILSRAAALGIEPHRVLVDPITMAAGADTSTAQVTLQTIALLRAALGVNIVLGTSNVSHGLPLRPSLNATFVAMAIALGARAPIVNPLDARMMETVRAANLFLGQDPWAMAWIKAFRANRAAAE